MHAPVRHHARKQRHGLHHKHNKRYLKTYLPYLPVVVAIAISLLISNAQALRTGTLAYATEMSISGLLQSTNNERAGSGQVGLSHNQLLTNAAQAKANDMIARNYWSHNTPDGQEPWVFVANAGYNYQKAGENLAYGFTTSSSTVTGWMNSPSHRANMLDGSFIEVGFGFANGSNYNSSGPQTVVVAMYGKPQTLGASAAPPPAAPPPAPNPVTPPSSQPSPSPQSQPTAQPPAAPTTVHDTPAEQQATQVAQPTEIPKQPINTDFPIITGREGLQPVSRIQVLTGGDIPWALFASASLCGIAVVLLLIKHSLAIRHVITKSERFILHELHNPWFDSVMVAIIILGFTLSRTVGFIG